MAGTAFRYGRANSAALLDYIVSPGRLSQSFSRTGNGCRLSAQGELARPINLGRASLAAHAKIHSKRRTDALGMLPERMILRSPAGQGVEPAP